MMVKWCGNCAVGARNCDNTRYMECTSKPFKLWEAAPSVSCAASSPVKGAPSGETQQVKPAAGMSSAEFERLMEEQIERSRAVLCRKANEYATQDRLHNFRVAAGLQGCTPIQALSGMMAKHTVSVYDMCESGKAYPLDLWQEKITDSINYLLILNAMVREGS